MTQVSKPAGWRTTYAALLSYEMMSVEVPIFVYKTGGHVGDDTSMQSLLRLVAYM